jgi:hypothetical protein
VSKRKSIADHALDVMREEGETLIYDRKLNICHEIYERSGGTRIHPQNKLKSVMDAVRKDKRFRPFGYLRACDCTGKREILHPVFTIKD